MQLVPGRVQEHGWPGAAQGWASVTAVGVQCSPGGLKGDEKWEVAV